MRKLFTLLIMLSICVVHAFGQVTYYSKAAATDFNATASWGTNADGSGTEPPAVSNADNFIIANSAAMQLSAGASVRTLAINTGSSLTVSNFNLTVEITGQFNAFLNVNAGGTLTVSGGELFINGNFLVASTATFNQSGGLIRIDGNSGSTTNSVASGTALVQFNSNLLNLTAGTLLIVDPHAAATSTNALAYSNSANYNCGVGHTLQYGDGISTDAGGNAVGFRQNTWVGSGRIALGNIVVNSLGGTNRIITNTYTHGISGNLTITSGDYQGSSYYVAGNIVNNGTLTTTGTLFLAKYLGGTASAATDPQTISGSGVFRNSTTTTTASFSSLTVNNTSSGGVTPGIPLSVSSTLTLTAGIVNTTAANILTLGTATAAGTLSGGSATAYINGPFARRFAASRTATGTYTVATLFPVGKNSTYLPIWIDPTTNAGGPVLFTGEAFTTNSGSMGAGVTSLSSNRWEGLISAGNANFTGAFLRLGDASIVTGNQILQAATASGAYGPIVPGTVFASGTPNTLTTSGSQITAAAFNGFFAYGDMNQCDEPTAQPTNFVASYMMSTGFVASFTAASPAPSNYLVVRYPAGSAVTPPVNFTNYSVGNALGTGTVRYAGTATSFTETGLAANTSYDYYTYSYNNSGCYGPVYLATAPLFANITTCTSAVGSPGTPTASGISSDRFMANWTASSTPDVEYLLDVATNSTFTTFLPGYEQKNVGNNLSSLIPGLTPNTPYYVRVRAFVPLTSCYSAITSTLTVWTECLAEAAPTAVQNFSTFTGAAPPPDCWKEATGVLAPATTFTSSTSSWLLKANGFANITNTNPGASINLYGTQNAWLISQPINLGSTPGLYRVSFNMAVTSYNGTVAQSTLSTHKVDIVVSTDGGATWSNANVIKTYTGAGAYSNTGQVEKVNLAGYSGIVKIAFVATTTLTTPDIDFHVDDFQVEELPASPAISVNPEVIALGYAPSGGTSAEMSYNLSGIFLTPADGNLTVTPPANFEVSLTSGSGYSSAPISVPYTGGTLASTPVYVVCKPTAPNTAYSGNISNTGGGAPEKLVAVSGTSQLVYCASNATSSGDTKIDNVTLNTLNQSSNPTTCETYTDYTGTATITNLSKTVTYDMSVTQGSCGGSYPSYIKVYIDFNQDGTFDEVTEMVFSKSSAGLLVATTGAVAIPGSAVLGTTRMRVVLRESGTVANTLACGTYSYGETEDYFVNITAAPACPPPSGLTYAPGTPPNSQAILSWTENGSATTWELEYGDAGFTQGAGTTIVTTNNPHPLGGLLSDHEYEFYVRADCGGTYSNWAGPKYFKTACEPSTAPFTESFESTTFPPQCWENKPVSGTYVWTRSTAASGYGSGTASAYANFFSQSAGSTYELITNQFDASSMTSPTLKFDYAYATYAGEVDQMDVYTSTDGGASWNLLLAMPGGAAGILNTGGTTTAGFVPTAGQWGTQNLALPAGTNKVKFRAISAWGNNLYLDNISVYEPVAHDVAVMSIDVNGALYNQPVTPQVTVVNNGTNTETFDVTLTATGGYSSTVQVVALAPGLTTQATFASWNPGPGTYTLEACTQLVGDLVPSNDCAQKQVQVTSWFPGMNMPATAYLGTAVGYTDNSVTPPVGYVYAIGGNTASNLGTECYKYNTMTDMWSSIASLPAGRRVLASAIVGKNIYAIAGSDMSSVYQSTVYKYDIDLDAWSTVAPLPIAAAWVKAVAVGSNIYVAGGVDAVSTVLSSVYVYNTITDVWAPATSMPGPLFGGAFSATGNTLVYVGGADLSVISDVVYVGTIDAGNPAVISWLTKSPFPGSNGKGVLAYKIDPMGQVATYIKEDNSNADPYPGGAMYRFDGAPWGPDGIIVAGGSPTSAWVPADPNPCYVYIPSTDTWIQKFNLPVPVLGSYVGSCNVNHNGISTWKLVVGSGLGNGGPTPATQVLTEEFYSQVTFNVDVSTINGFDHATELIYIAGDFPGAIWNEPGTNPNLLLSRVGVTDIYTITLDLPDGAYQYKYFRNATWSFGEWSGGPNRNINVSGNTATEDVFGGDITFANLQWPANGSVPEGGMFNVYGQAYIPNGITGAPGATYGLEVWVGIHTDNTNPSGWATWVPATFNTQIGDYNDEFTADIAAGLTPGTYYYAFRYRFGQTYGEYLYGGFNGGFWDGINNVSGELTITPPVTNRGLYITVFLEGPFNGVDMDTELNTNDLIPLNQPFNAPPWNYAGTESVVAIPAGVVDWVLVELRDSDDPANADETTTFMKQAYFLKYDGTIVDLSGAFLPSLGNPVLTNDMYVVVRHRNHIDVLSNTAVPLVGNAYTYDFSTALTQAYGAGAGYKLLGGTIYGMVSGDADADGKVFSSDFIEWATESGNLGVYSPADMDFDGNVFASDAVLWAGNSGMDNPIESGLSQVPVYTTQVPGDK